MLTDTHCARKQLERDLKRSEKPENFAFVQTFVYTSSAHLLCYNLGFFFERTDLRADGGRSKRLCPSQKRHRI